MEKIAVLIPVFNRLEYTKKCLQNLSGILNANQDLKRSFELIVADDASSDGTFSWIKENYQAVHVLEGDGDLWWSGGINLGAKYAIEELKCSHVLLWNNDIEVTEEYFVNLLEAARAYNDQVIIGSKIYGNLEKKLVWSMGGIFNPRTGKSIMIGYLTEDNPELQKPVEADWLTGMGTLVPVRVIKEIGYWDKENYPQYNGDMEFTYRAKLAGFKNIVVPDLKIWNDTTNTGLLHEGSLKNMIKMLSDKRSLYNWKVNTRYYKQYATSPLAYFFLFMNYFKFFGGFFKWKILSFFGVKRKLTFE